MVGAVRIGDQFMPTQYILEKGGFFNLEEMQTKQARLAQTYNTKQGDIEFYLIENE